MRKIETYRLMISDVEDPTEYDNEIKMYVPADMLEDVMALAFKNCLKVRVTGAVWDDDEKGDF